MQTLATVIERLQLGPDDLLFPSTDKKGGRLLSRNTFRTKIWLPAVSRAGIGYLHTLPDSDDRALAAFRRVRSS